MMAPSRPPRGMTADSAQTVALNALAFLLADQDRAARFCAACGLGGQNLAEQLADPAFLGGVLDFVLDDELLLTEVASAVGVTPEAVAAARRRLPGAPTDV